VVNGKDDDAHRKFMRDRGLEVAHFLIWAIKEKGIPRASADGKTGGIALLGWSAGNFSTLAFLRNLETFPKEIMDTLAQYVRTLFLYEVAFAGLGYPPPPGAYHPFHDPTLDSRQRGVIFGTWVSAYYAHPYYLDDFPDKENRRMYSLQVQVPKSGAAPRMASNETFAPDEILEMIDLEPSDRSEQAWWNVIKPELLYEQLCGGIIVQDKAKLLLPNLKLFHIYGTQSIWSILWAAWEFEKDQDKWKAEGKTIRPLTIVPVEDANHFMHWDEPELFLQTCEEGIRA